MPTRADFELAADKFQAAAAQIDDLTAAAASVDTDDILRGGSLGRQVPARIAAAAATARVCRDLIGDAEITCRERAQIIDEYERAMVLYERALVIYEAQYLSWWAEYCAAMAAGGGGSPGSAPTPPVAPPPPPAWADV